jgi:UDP-glucuronate 4-epimerase
MATQIADAIRVDDALAEPPGAVDALEAVAVFTRENRLEREVVEALQNGEVRPRTGVIVVAEFDRGVGDAVHRARRTVGIEDDPVVVAPHCPAALHPIGTARGTDLGVREQRRDPVEIAAIKAEAVLVDQRPDRLEIGGSGGRHAPRLRAGHAVCQSRPMTLTANRILVTGATGAVGGPVARALAADNDVTAVGRFGDAAATARLEQAGVHCQRLDLESGELGSLPGDFDVVLHFAVAKTNDFDRDLRANVEGLGFLMEHCTQARWLCCSSTAVYEPDGHRRFVESDPLGDNHRAFGFMPTYSITKIAAESMARYQARARNIRTVIARLSVPYGDSFGWPAFHLAMMRAGHAVPVHIDAPSEYNPIHIDDIIEQIPALLDAATTDANTVNWAGDDIVSIETWCAYLGELADLTPKFEPTDRTIASVACDTTKRRAITGPCAVDWKTGLAGLWAAHRAG